MNVKKLLLLIILFACNVCIAQTVHYTRTGAKYHSAGCKYLRKSDMTCTLEEAFRKGLSPCSFCAPPTEIEKPKPVEQKQKSKKRSAPQTGKNARTDTTGLTTKYLSKPD